MLGQAGQAFVSNAPLTGVLAYQSVYYRYAIGHMAAVMRLVGPCQVFHCSAYLHHSP